MIITKKEQLLMQKDDLLFYTTITRKYEHAAINVDTMCYEQLNHDDLELQCSRKKKDLELLKES